MQKNDLVTIDSKRNTVLDGAFSGERVTHGKGGVYIGEMPLIKDNYRKLEIIDDEQLKAFEKEKKKAVGKTVIGLAVFAPFLLPFADSKKELDKIGSMMKVVWNSGEESILFVDKSIVRELMHYDESIADTIRDVAGALVKEKKTPVYLSDFQREDFHIPNVLKIVDDAQYKNKKELAGAVGWRESIRKTEVLFLFDEAIPESGLILKPTPQCNSIYHVHNYHRNTFIMLNSLIDEIQAERVAELKHIAYALGAKKYEIIVKTNGVVRERFTADTSKKAKVWLVDANQKESMEKNYMHSESHLVKSSAEYETDRDPVRPNMVWFENNSLIADLIDRRVDKNDRTHSMENITISCSTCTAMSLEAAERLDVSVKKIGGGTSASMKSRIEKENHQTLEFNVEF